MFTKIPHLFVFVFSISCVYKDLMPFWLCGFFVFVFFFLFLSPSPIYPVITFGNFLFVVALF